MIIEWTRTAVADLAYFRSYIAERNPTAAKSMADLILKFIGGLEEFPSRGRPGQVPQTRELVIPAASVFVPYRVSGTKLQIIAVVHTSRRWP